MKINWLPESTKLRMLRDQILVKPLEWSPSTVILIAGNQRRTLRGEVIQVGPGQRQKRYHRNDKGERHKVSETGRVIPTDLKPGDVVELGGLELDGYRFQEITIGSELHVICQEADVCGIVEP